MSRQLNLRVSDAFARTLERVAKRTGRPMAAVLEAVGTPALEAAEEDARFEAEARPVPAGANHLHNYGSMQVSFLFH